MGSEWPAGHSQLDAFSWEEGEKAELTELLDTLLDDAYERGVLEENQLFTEIFWIQN